MKILRKELGVLILLSDTDDRWRSQDDWHRELVEYFLACPFVDKTLDVIEVICLGISRIAAEPSYLRRPNAKQIAQNGIQEINARFREHSVGYEFSDSHIMRVDSQLIHREVVVPALRLLNQPRYLGAACELCWKALYRPQVIRALAMGPGVRRLSFPLSLLVMYCM